MTKTKDSMVLTTQVDVALPRNKKYQSGNIISRRLIQGFMRSLLDLAGQVKPTAVFEAGCGEGIILRQLRALWPEATLHGIDIVPELLQISHQLIPSAQTWQASIYELPLPDKQYDMVFCTEVMEHLAEPAKALAELARVGKGYCLLSVPHEPWWRMANMARGRYLRQWGNTPRHVNHWSSRAFQQFLSAHVDILEVRQPFPWTMVLGKIR